jgi:hypothetical protein
MVYIGSSHRMSANISLNLGSNFNIYTFNPVERLLEQYSP